jgi:hypothetical protein
MNKTTIINKVLLRFIKKANAFKTIIICGALMISSGVFASDSTLKVQYSFSSSTVSDSIQDNSGNGYNAKLQNSAIVKKLGRFDVLDLGSLNGYLDMGTKTGRIIKTLTDFTVALYVYVDPSVSLSTAGNFIWTFANSADMNSTANGNMFFTALSNRYAISKTNWSGETSVNLSTALTKGSWQHVTYTQSGTTGTIYVNGVVAKSGTVSTKPSDLGATTNNYLAKSCYSTDAYLTKSMLNDFRLYSRALSATEVLSLASQKAGLDSALVIQQVTDAQSQLAINGLDSVISNLNLPTTGGNSVVITWSSSNTGIISNTGVVTRPGLGGSPVTIKLTATLTKNGISATKEFSAKVIPYLSDKMSVASDSLNLQIPGHLTSLTTNLTLSLSGNEGSVITWSSGAPSVLSATGILLSRPAKGAGKTKVSLTATLKKGTVTAIKTFDIYIAENDVFSAYLFAYFTGNDITQEAIRFATSDDAYTYRALNNDNPVVSSATVSSSGGVRDPHILRGEGDNSYYMVATDMVSALGWDSNRAMVLLKSTDLINWQSAVVNIPNTYTKYSTADRVWAPQTIYDPTVGKYMVYFAMRLGSSDYDKIYYAYANSTFTALESSPELLFDNGGLSTIDPDIILKDGVYNLFFKTEGNGDGIKKATSANLTGGYVLVDKYLQSTTNPVEGSSVFKLINSVNYIMMYDMYTSGAYQFTITTDLLNFSVAPTPISFDFTPRHGTIIPVTAAEKQALMNKWNPTSGIKTASESTAISVYPNPAKELLNISINGADSNIKVSVTDITGKELISKTIQNNPAQIDVSGLSQGIYLISCITKEGVSKCAKFVVQ